MSDVEQEVFADDEQEVFDEVMQINENIDEDVDNDESSTEQ